MNLTETSSTMSLTASRLVQVTGCMRKEGGPSAQAARGPVQRPGLPARWQCGALWQPGRREETGQQRQQSRQAGRRHTQTQRRQPGKPGGCAA